MDQSGSEKCRMVCWGIGVIAGISAFWVAWAPVSLIAALLLGLAIAVLVGLVLVGLFCRGNAHTAPIAASGDGDTTAVAADTAAVDAEKEAVAAEERAAAEKAKADADASAKAKAEQAAAERAAKDAKTAKAAEDAAAAAKPEVEAAESDGLKPEGLSGARDGQADNLKAIKGIGPKLEILCNDMGFYHFDQIAAWGPQEVAYMDANLKGFRGRVTRDGWIEQAKLLAAGDETEFSKRVKKGSVY